MLVLILVVESPLPGFPDINSFANKRRTTLTRHQNHHVGTLSSHSGGYILSPFGGTGSTIPPSTSTGSGPRQQASPYAGSYFADPTGSSMQSLAMPSLPPPAGYALAPSLSPFGHQQAGHATRSSTSSIGTSPSQRSAHTPRYSQPPPTLPPPPPFRPMQPPRQQYATPGTSFSRRTQSVDSTVRATVQDFPP